MITLFRKSCGPLSADILYTEKFAFSVVGIIAFLVPESLACQLVDSNYWYKYEMNNDVDPFEIELYDQKTL